MFKIKSCAIKKAQWEEARLKPTICSLILAKEPMAIL